MLAEDTEGWRGRANTGQGQELENTSICGVHSGGMARTPDPDRAVERPGENRESQEQVPREGGFRKTPVPATQRVSGVTTGQGL